MRCILAGTVKCVAPKDRNPNPPQTKTFAGVGTTVKICTANCGRTVRGGGMVPTDTAYTGTYQRPIQRDHRPTAYDFPFPRNNMFAAIIPNDFWPSIVNCSSFQQLLGNSIVVVSLIVIVVVASSSSISCCCCTWSEWWEWAES